MSTGSMQPKTGPRIAFRDTVGGYVSGCLAYYGRITDLSDGMRQPDTPKLALAGLCLLFAGITGAQETAMDDKRFRINRIADAPQIDGRITPGEWDGAARVSDLHQVQPVEFVTPSQRTVWYFAYDDRAL